MVEAYNLEKRVTLPERKQEMTSRDIIKPEDLNFLSTETDGMSDIATLEKIILTSYPRCGNTLLRTYLEQLTNIYTGSDCDLRRPMNKQLKDMGMQGEG